MKKQIVFFLFTFLFAVTFITSCDNPVTQDTTNNSSIHKENTVLKNRSESSEEESITTTENKLEEVKEEPPEIANNGKEIQQEFNPDPKYGKEIFNNTCASCHGITGAGDGVASAGLTPKPRDLRNSDYISSLSDKHLFKTISGGGSAVGLSPLMPPWKGILTDQQIKDVISHIRTNICQCNSKSKADEKE